MSKLDQDKLKAIFDESVESTERQADCPDDYLLGSYMEGGLSERDHIQFESHLADCTYCIERVGILGRAGESGVINVEPKQPGTQSGKLPSPRRYSRWATAALVVLTVGFMANRMTTDGVSSIPTEPEQPSFVSERAIGQVSPFPEILYPQEGGLVDLQSLVFKWKEVPGSLYYDIRVVSDDGAQIARQRVWGTQWPLPPEAQLQMGAEYFVRVDAYVSEGKTVSSEHTLFTVGGTQP